jgi:tRNA-dihydrouridine synthase B
VLAATGADAVMIGRAAQGRPWIFREIVHFLATGTDLAAPSTDEIKILLIDHLLEHYDLYGDVTGLYTARKHIGWYVQGMAGGEAFRQQMNQLQSCEQQLQAVNQFFSAP